MPQEMTHRQARNQAQSADTIKELIPMVKEGNHVAAGKLSMLARALGAGYFDTYERFVAPATDLSLGAWDALLARWDVYDAQEREL